MLTKVFARRPFEYDVIDVMAPEQEKWKAVYEFDTPVVCTCPSERGVLYRCECSMSLALGVIMWD